MSLQLAFAHAAGEGPQAPSTPLIALPLHNAPSMHRAVAHKPRQTNGTTRRRLSKDRWLVTSDGERLGRIKRIARRSPAAWRVYMEHRRHKDIVQYASGRGRCAETGVELMVQKGL